MGKEKFMPMGKPIEVDHIFLGIVTAITMMAGIMAGMIAVGSYGFPEWGGWLTGIIVGIVLIVAIYRINKRDG